MEFFKKLFSEGVFFSATLETIYMTLISTFFAYVFGLIIGIILYSTGKKGIRPMPALNKILGIIVNILRSIPFIILMVALLPVSKALIGTSIGNGAMIITLIIAATPYVARIVESNLKEVNQGVIEAAEAMGANNFEIIFKVILPEAKPSLFVGGIISLITILGYSAMAGTIGAGGLGKIAISYGYQRYNNLIIWFCILLIVIIVQIIQEVGMNIATKIDKRLK